MSEIWKPIKDFEKLYEVSNQGRIRSLDRKVPRGNHSLNIKGRILKPENDKDGYKLVSLSKNGIEKMQKVHRLVAQAFLPNINNYPHVNHKDENKSNNCVENLEWCDAGYNNNYGNHNDNMKKCMNARYGKAVNQYKINGTFIRSYESTRLAGRMTGIDYCSIRRCCQGLNKTAGGYLWSYKNIK